MTPAISRNGAAPYPTSSSSLPTGIILRWCTSTSGATTNKHDPARTANTIAMEMSLRWSLLISAVAYDRTFIARALVRSRSRGRHFGVHRRRRIRDDSFQQHVGRDTLGLAFEVEDHAVTHRGDGDFL